MPKSAKAKSKAKPAPAAPIKTTAKNMAAGVQAAEAR
jgi:hypothetical protein